MIPIGKNNTAAIRIGKTNVAAVYLGKVLVWQPNNSCFGSGAWREDKPWVDSEMWRE